MRTKTMKWTPAIILVLLVAVTALFILLAVPASATGEPVSDMITSAEYGVLDSGMLTTGLAYEEQYGMIEIIDIAGDYYGTVTATLYYWDGGRGELICETVGNNPTTGTDDLMLEAGVTYYYEVSWTASGSYGDGVVNGLITISPKTLDVDMSVYTFTGQYGIYQLNDWYNSWLVDNKVQNSDEVYVNWYYMDGPNKVSFDSFTNAGTYVEAKVELTGGDADKYDLNVQYPTDMYMTPLDYVPEIVISPKEIEVNLSINGNGLWQYVDGGIPVNNDLYYNGPDGYIYEATTMEIGLGVHILAWKDAGDNEYDTTAITGTTYLLTNTDFELYDMYDSGLVLANYVVVNSNFKVIIHKRPIEIMAPGIVGYTGGPIYPDYEVVYTTTGYDSVVYPAEFFLYPSSVIGTERGNEMEVESVMQSYKVVLGLEDEDNYTFYYNSEYHISYSWTYEIVAGQATVILNEIEPWYYRDPTADYTEKLDVDISTTGEPADEVTLFRYGYGIVASSLYITFDKDEYGNANPMFDLVSFISTLNAGDTFYIAVETTDSASGNFVATTAFHRFDMEKAPVFIRTNADLTYSGEEQKPGADTFIYYIYKVEDGYEWDTLRPDLPVLVQNAYAYTQAQTAAGSYALQGTITTSGGLSDQYEIADGDAGAVYVIKKLAFSGATITIDPVAYGAYPAYSVVYNGYVGDDNAVNTFATETWTYNNVAEDYDGVWTSWNDMPILSVGTYYAKLEATFSNYTLTPATASFVINQRELTFTWRIGEVSMTNAEWLAYAGGYTGEGVPTLADTLVYNGSMQLPVYTLTNVLYGDTVNVTSVWHLMRVNDAWDWDNEDACIVAGIHGLNLNSVDNANYKLPHDGSETVYFTINKAELTVTADNKNITYGDAAPAYTATITGFVGGESAEVITGAAALACPYGQYSAVTTYTITTGIGTLAADNYSFTLVNGTLTVGNATITGVTVEQQSELTYNGNLQGNVTYDATTLRPEDICTYTWRVTGSGGDYTPTLPKFTDAGVHSVDYKITCSNYDDVTGSFEITIGQFEVTYELRIDGTVQPGNSIEYDGNSHTATAVVTNAIGEDVVTIAVTGSPVATDRATYNVALTLGGAAAANYKFSNGTATTAAQWGIGYAQITGVSISQSGTLTYNGLAQTAALDKAATTQGENKDPVFYYSTNYQAGDWSTTLPAYTNAGTYRVYYKITAPDHSDYGGTAAYYFQITIGQKLLTIEFDTVKTYNGQSQKPTVNSMEGVVEGDEIGVLFTGGTTANAGNWAGAWALEFVLTGDKKDNYYCESYESEFTIQQLTVAIDWSDCVFTYDGNTHAPTATITNTVEGDTVSIVLSNNSFKTDANIGTNVYTATAASLTGADAGNYKLPTDDTKSVAFRINPLAVTVTYDSTHKTVTYGDSDAWDALGEEMVANEYYLVADLVAGDNIFEVVSMAVLNAQLEPVEPDDTLPAGTYTLSATSLGNRNYAVTVELGDEAYLQVDNATLTGVGVVQSGTLTYNAENQTATVTPSATAKNAQVVSFTYSATDTGEYTASVPAFKDAGTYTVYFKANAANHNQETGHFTVTIGRFVMIPVVSFDGSTTNFTAVYDGAEHTFAITAAVPEGNGTFVFISQQHTNVSSGEYTVLAEAYRHHGGEPLNYEVLTPVAGSWSITAKPITIAVAAKNSHYGDAQVALTADESQIVEGDTNVYSLACTVTATSPVGTYNITGTALDTNYNITFTGEENAYTVTARPITIAVAAKNSHYGDAQVALTADESQIVNGDTNVYSLACTVTATSPVGTYNITGTALDENYAITFTGEANAYTVTARPITIAVAAKTSHYGDAQVALTADESQIVNGDTNVYSLACTVTATSDVGDYDITGTALDENYAITFTGEEDAYTVTARPITIAVAAKTSNYGDAQVALTADESQIVNGDIGVYSLACTVTATSDVGDYDITGTALDENYAITFTGEEDAYTVTARPITIAVAAKTSNYGDAQVALTADESQIVNGDIGVYSLACTVNATSPVGKYNITGTALDENYAITFTGEAEAYTVTARPITIAVTAKNSNYGDAQVALTADNSQLVNGDAPAAVYSLACTVNATSPVGKYNITGTALDENYAITFTGEANAYTVTARPITIAVTAKNSNYGDAQVALTADESQIVNGDTNVYTLACAVTATSPVGAYNITGTAVDTNYAITFTGEANAYTVTARPITIAVAAKTSVYGDTPVALTADESQIVNGDTNVYTLACTVTATSDVGAYNITGTAVDTNYAITFTGEANAYTVTAREVTLTWGTTSFIYNKASQKPSVTLGNVVNNDTVNATVSGEQTNVGNYTATAAIDNANYKLPAVHTQSFAIAKAASAIDLTNMVTSLAYTGEALTFTGATAYNNEAAIAYAGNVQTKVGTYTVTVSVAETANFLAEETTVTVAVVEAAPTKNDAGVAEYYKVVDTSEDGKVVEADVTTIFKNAAAEEGDSTVKLEAGDAIITFDKTAVAALGAADSVKWSYEAKKGAEAASQVKGSVTVFEIKVDGATFADGKATVTVPFVNEAPAGKVAKVYYIDENGKKVDMNGTFENGMLTFETNHFSTYAVKYVLKGSTVALIIILIVVVLAAVGVVVFFLLKKKKGAPKADDKKAEPKEEKAEPEAEEAKEAEAKAEEPEAEEKAEQAEPEAEDKQE